MEAGIPSRMVSRSIPLTTDRRDGALLEVGAKPGNLPEIKEDGGKVLNVFLDGRQEDRRVIRIERGSNLSMTPADFM
jgi:hypothetical protein